MDSTTILTMLGRILTGMVRIGPACAAYGGDRRCGHAVDDRCSLARKAAILPRPRIQSIYFRTGVKDVWRALRTHWVTTTNFIGLLLIPRFRVYLGTSSAVLCPSHLRAFL
jgi:hypothetical protein